MIEGADRRIDHLTERANRLQGRDDLIRSMLSSSDDPTAEQLSKDLHKELLEADGALSEWVVRREAAMIRLAELRAAENADEESELNAMEYFRYRSWPEQANSSFAPDEPSKNDGREDQD